MSVVVGEGQGTHNTKQGAINHLPILLQQLADARLERLALIVDADQVADGGGFAQTVEQVRNVINKFGFVSNPMSLPEGGLVFEHEDGLAEFGLWVMPNNRDDGTLEEWVCNAIHPNEAQLFADAKTVVSGLATPKFVPLRRTKADVATWLAWQVKPGEGLYFSVQGGLLDQTSNSYAGLLKWMEKIFR